MAGNGYQSGWGGDRQHAGDQAGSTLPDRGGYGAYGSGYGARPDDRTIDGGRARYDDRTRYDGARYDGAAGHDGGAGYGGGAGHDGGAEQPYYYDSGHEPRQDGGAGQPYYYEDQAASQDHVTTYRAGGRTAPRIGGPRLAWRELLIGIYRAPARTFDQMRDHQAWLPAITVSLLYGALAVFGFGDTHNDVVGSTFSVAAWSMFGAALGFTLCGLMLGSVTYALARQFGGDGPYASTVGLAVLIGWTTDAPRLLLALFLPSASPVVQLLGWVSWLLCAVLLTTLVRRVHDLPWGKAAGAAAVQLLALLVLIKLPTLG
ncbi:YIP1 family protein [Kitasatospora sp. RB6PN24]|uniref:Yip1 family protein n=1 Tax=Kitasatospora humi TaxID=2893891 RepID=UPI001E63C70F|nr:Yip1 family protein [Kitasatospora humi]MCC9311257.1 YIP1 family protein [Kitasatospora humi]